MNIWLFIIFSNGVGRVEIKRKRPIESYDDIVALDEFISKNNGVEGLFVTNFKLLREYEEVI